MSSRKIPINRLDKFFSEEDFNFEIEMGMEFYDDINTTIVLHKIDRDYTQYDDLYGETNKNEISYYPPVEIQGMVTIEEPNNTNINNNGTLRYNESGNLRVKLFNKELSKLNVDIDYGDYVGYLINEDKVVYYSVVDDGKKNFNNTKTIGGYKSAFREIICSPVNEDEFNG